MNVISAYNKVQKNAKDTFDPSLHIEFVTRIAKSLSKKIPQFLSVEDLIQVGLIELLDVHERYLPNENTSFEAYASFRIKGAMIDLIRENTPISKEKMALIRKIHRFIDEFYATNGFKPRDAFIAENLGISIEKYHDCILEYESVFSVNIDDVSLLDASILSHEHRISDDQLKKILIESIKMLNEKEQKIISLYYVDELTQSEIADIFSITESRVSQILSQTICKLRKIFQSFN